MLKNHTAKTDQKKPPDQRRPKEKEETKEASKEQKIATFFGDKGIRYTAQRHLVLEILQRKEGHVSAEEIHHEITVRFPGVNLSTIYRTLEVLCELGVMVEVVNRKDDRKRFEFVGESPHFHLQCENCGKEEEVEESVIQQIKDQTLQNYGIKLELGHFVGLNRCKFCREGIPADKGQLAS